VAGPTDPADLRTVAASFSALAHPTRLAILGQLRDGGVLSPKLLALRVTPPTALANVAHHTRELATLGLLEPAGTRPARGALEHFYRLSPLGRDLAELVDRVSARVAPAVNPGPDAA
jgi:DNA-binding transcriptional ArsR family regulator